MALISNLSVGITANMRGLDRGLAKTKKKIKRFVGDVSGIKTGIAAALGGVALGAVFSKSLSAWKQQEQALASLQAANESMGRSSVNLTRDMTLLASQLQAEGIIGDESIIQGQSFLSTFSQIPDELLPRATRAMVDLMAKTGKTGAGAANMIGKAAMGQSGALKIAGITLSSTTLKAIKAEQAVQKMADKAGISLDGMGNNGNVFKLILSDIESQIGGTNKALGKTASGGIQQFNNGLGDMFEILGQIISIGISPWARQLAVEMASVKVNAEEMGISFKQAMFDSIMSIAPFLESLKGIHLVLKSIEIGFAGFELLARGVFLNVAKGVNAIASIFGSDFGGEAARSLETAFDNQLGNVATLKKEFSTIYDEIEGKTLTANLTNRLRDFDAKSEATLTSLNAPTIKAVNLAPAPQPRKDPLYDNDKSLIINQQMKNGIDQTNELLRQLNSSRYTAVAG